MARTFGGAVQPPCGPVANHADAGGGGSHPGVERQAQTARWLDALEHAQACGALGISHMMVARVWRKHALRPHRLEGYMASNDPEFETKAADIIGLYLHPPQHAAVFCVDEKTAIQALDRKDPVLPLSPGRAERHGFEYYRHGTLSLYAAFNTKTGEVLGKTAARHTSAEFVAFLSGHRRQPAARQRDPRDRR